MAAATAGTDVWHRWCRRALLHLDLVLSELEEARLAGLERAPMHVIERLRTEEVRWVAVSLAATTALRRPSISRLQDAVFDAQRTVLAQLTRREGPPAAASRMLAAVGGAEGVARRPRDRRPPQAPLPRPWVWYSVH
ncbi:MAG TPA: hypothetical protein VNN74_02075 [Candidatus Micrarchaeia archaeon]|nr:hypothetical protein [Candidatus Micrarchaeia archaeon]